jgi:hypothetical protein
MLFDCIETVVRLMRQARPRNSGRGASVLKKAVIE